MGKPANLSSFCELIELGTCHVFFGDPWQYDMDATYRGWNNTFSFSWKQKRIIVVPNKVEGNTPNQKKRALISIPLMENDIQLGIEEADAKNEVELELDETTK